VILLVETAGGYRRFVAIYCLHARSSSILSWNKGASQPQRKRH